MTFRVTWQTEELWPTGPFIQHHQQEFKHQIDALLFAQKTAEKLGPGGRQVGIEIIEEEKHNATVS